MSGPLERHGRYTEFPMLTTVRNAPFWMQGSGVAGGRLQGRLHGVLLRRRQSRRRRHPRGLPANRCQEPYRKKGKLRQTQTELLVPNHDVCLLRWETFVIG
jgi:hypothetical protein